MRRAAAGIVGAALLVVGAPAVSAGASPATSASAAAQTSATRWTLLGLERSEQGLVVTARATREGSFWSPGGWWTQVAGMSGCPAVHVLDPSTAHLGLARAKPTGSLCQYDSDGPGLGDGESATVSVVLADPGGQSLDVVVDDQLLATDVPVTGPAAQVVESSGPAAGVVVPHLRQVTPQPRFTRAGAAVTGQAVDLSTDVLFAYDSDVLGPDAGAAIEVAAQQLQAQPSRTVTITGHTDSQGDTAYNLGLSQRRAEAVRAALAAQLGAGWTLNASGVGESDPVADESRPSGLSGAEADAAVAEAQRVNRRVAVVPG